ncbi:16S rRNA methyltransferase [Caldanaerobacter subterraneus subsp. yonseiensis KB-1]|uniref:Ribosomal RNA small subunit methyltransferase G n=1 Tax=Caldanaerobacter subterraneus subsp. yonseiensis KB-1 TaxID=1388761 RepID=U5CP99_CALSX|nr:16S rRNA (guanine(527)-N(7))-methyltransferase RsmG [Caldanaerobacter subterraneus]ERM91609.1 16S rRNA methyltransferase [Caldanaerobacter subterraneus subsp. yonseiensis KB-1]
MKQKSIEMLVQGASSLGITLEMFHVEHFQKFYSLLFKWNQKMNLTAITEEEEVVIKHFLDSLSVIKSGKIKGGEKVIDIGTGAGFPGIPLKIVFPEIRLTLLEASKKKVNFLNFLSQVLLFEGIEVIHGRAEELGKVERFREKFDIATARAVAPLNILLEYAVPFVRVGGHFIAMKGRDIEEVYQCKNALEELKCEIEDVIEVRLPFSDILHHLIVVKKVDVLPSKYPRREKAIRTKPL